MIFNVGSLMHRRYICDWFERWTKVKLVAMHLYDYGSGTL